MSEAFTIPPVPESFKIEIGNRIAACHQELTDMPAIATVGERTERALAFMRAVVSRFGFNAMIDLNLVGVELIPGDAPLEFSVEVTNEDAYAWTYAVGQYRGENHAYAALQNLAHEWESVLANLATEGNWQPYSITVGMDSAEDDRCVYQAIQERGVVAIMLDQLESVLTRYEEADYIAELMLIKAEAERIFGAEA